MKTKEKRKRTPTTDLTLGFDTALTVDECVARLKDAAFNSLDHRLSIRATDERFVVEIVDPATAAKYKPGENWLARFEGQYHMVRGKTLVWGKVVENETVRQYTTLQGCGDGLFGFLMGVFFTLAPIYIL
ncbi:MAG: hypothetical protein K8S97_02110, partial [Anaerolineae bacterium]|nr:hypothetical protein [Anaerolineae bacterium]